MYLLLLLLGLHSPLGPQSSTVLLHLSEVHILWRREQLYQSSSWCGFDIGWNERVTVLYRKLKKIGSLIWLIIEKFRRFILSTQKHSQNVIQLTWDADSLIFQQSSVKMMTLIVMVLLSYNERFFKLTLSLLQNFAKLCYQNYFWTNLIVMKF